MIDASTNSTLAHPQAGTFAFSTLTSPNSTNQSIIVPPLYTSGNVCFTTSRNAYFSTRRANRQVTSLIQHSYTKANKIWSPWISQRTACVTFISCCKIISPHTLYMFHRSLRINSHYLPKHHVLVMENPDCFLYGTLSDFYIYVTEIRSSNCPRTDITLYVTSNSTSSLILNNPSFCLRSVCMSSWKFSELSAFNRYFLQLVPLWKYLVAQKSQWAVEVCVALLVVTSFRYRILVDVLSKNDAALLWRMKNFLHRFINFIIQSLKWSTVAPCEQTSLTLQNSEFGP